MADTKIASLTNGLTTSATDRIPVAISPYGSGNNAYITPSYLKTFMVTGGTVTSSTPVFDMTQTWNSGAVTFSGLKLNVTDTASASGSLLIDAQIGGSSRGSLRKDGTLTLSNGTQSCAIDPYNFIGNRSGTMYIYNQNASGFLALGVTNSVYGLTIDNTGSVSFAGSAGTSILKSDAANTLALQNGTNAQTFNIYNTSTSSNANYERLAIKWTGTIALVGTEKGGTGSGRPIFFGSNLSGLPDAYVGYQGTYHRFFCSTSGTETWNLSTQGHWLTISDNTYDIGAVAANRPRNVYLANNLTVGAFTGMGATPVSSAVLSLAASTTSNTAINFASGVAPTSPNNGDFWFDGTDFKARVGGVTKTFTLV